MVLKNAKFYLQDYTGKRCGLFFAPILNGKLTRFTVDSKEANCLSEINNRKC